MSIESSAAPQQATGLDALAAGPRRAKAATPRAPRSRFQLPEPEAIARTRPSAKVGAAHQQTDTDVPTRPPEAAFFQPMLLTPPVAGSGSAPAPDSAGAAALTRSVNLRNTAQSAAALPTVAGLPLAATEQLATPAETGEAETGGGVPAASPLAAHLEPGPLRALGLQLPSAQAAQQPQTVAAELNLANATSPSLPEASALQPDILTPPPETRQQPGSTDMVRQAAPAEAAQRTTQPMEPPAASARPAPDAAPAHLPGGRVHATPAGHPPSPGQQSQTPPDRDSADQGAGQASPKTPGRSASPQQMPPFRLDAAQAPDLSPATGGPSTARGAEPARSAAAADALPPADVRIIPGRDAAIAVTIAAGSPGLRDRIAAAEGELRADLARIGTEVEAIHVELRGESGPQSGSSQDGSAEGAQAGRTWEPTVEFRPDQWATEQFDGEPPIGSWPPGDGEQAESQMGESQMGDANMDGRSAASGQQPGRQPTLRHATAPPPITVCQPILAGSAPPANQSARIDLYA